MRKDLVREFAEAFRVEVLKVGFYYSRLDGHHPAAREDISTGEFEIKKGQVLLNIHIPQGEPLRFEACEDLPDSAGSPRRLSGRYSISKKGQSLPFSRQASGKRVRYLYALTGYHKSSRERAKTSALPTTVITTCSLRMTASMIRMTGTAVI